MKQAKIEIKRDASRRFFIVNTCDGVTRKIESVASLCDALMNTCMNMGSGETITLDLRLQK